MKYIFAHDIGTTGVKSCLFDGNLELKGYRYNPTNTWYLPGGVVEQDPNQWWSIISSTMKRLAEDASVDPADIAGICVDGHMNGCIPVDENGELLMARAPLWADFSPQKQAKELENLIGLNHFYEITGCGMDMPIYPVAKIRKLKEVCPEVYRKAKSFIATKDYINMKLTGRCCTDYSDAANSGMLDIRTGKWSEEILRAAGIDPDKMPELCESTEVIGGLTKEAAKECGLLPGTPVVCGCGDVPSASVGAGAYKEGVYYINIGSATWLSRSYPIDRFLCDKAYKPFVLRHAVPGLLAAQNVSFGGGICFQWIVDTLAAVAGGDDPENKKAAADDLYRRIEQRPQKTADRSGELFFLPYLRGGVPENPRMKGSFIGLSMEHDAFDMIDAIQEGVAYHLKMMTPFIADNIDQPMTRVNIIGGGARSGRWCRTIADVCDVEIACAPELQSATARGTAVIGGVGCGLFPDFSAVEHLSGQWNVYEPNKETRAYYDAGFKRFEQLYRDTIKMV